MSACGINEWTLLREQFQTLAREKSDTIDDIWDAQFRGRFSELINRLAERENIKSEALPDSNLIMHLHKYAAHRNLPKKRKRNSGSSKTKRQSRGHLL
jgi:hypothetical protein